MLRGSILPTLSPFNETPIIQCFLVKSLGLIKRLSFLFPILIPDTPPLDGAGKYDKGAEGDGLGRECFVDLCPAHLAA